MSLKALAEYTRVAKYAKYNKEKGRRENWKEQVNRVFAQHEAQLRNLGKLDEMKESLAFAKEAMLDKSVLGSQRILQFGGEAILKKNPRAFNCTVSYCDRPRFFQECMFLLLCGCGTGSSMQRHHVAKLPKITKRTGEEKIFVVPDTIEGWADALGVLLSSYFVKNQPFPEYVRKKVVFDFSKVRPEGSPLSWGGVAPGPQGLMEALVKIEAVIEARLAEGEDRMHPIDCYDIKMHASDAVLSGGVRRSASCVVFSLDDDEMMNAKTGDWFVKNPQRGRSNNSVLLVRGQVTKEQFNNIIKSTKEFGEPGFVWAENTEVLYNPCFEIGFIAYDKDGNSGWNFCNLCTINMKKIKSKDEMIAAAKAAAIIGTIQATYTNFEYLGKVSEDISRLESLLGISMTGMMDNPDIAFNEEIQRLAAKEILDINAIEAKKLGINPCARGTCIKPEGTATCLLEAMGSGVHPAHAVRYIRYVQANKLELALAFFEMHNPRAVQKSVWSSNKTDKVISFLCEVPKGAISKKQVSAVDLLKKVVFTQQNWVEYGVRPNQPYPYLRHNVSNTITVKDGEWGEVADFIFENQKHLAAVSLLPFSGDKDYPQAPFTTVFTAAEILEEYGDGCMFASGLIVEALELWDGNLWAATDCVLGIGDQPLPECVKGKWVEKVANFSYKYLSGDFKRATYLLKDVYNWKLWCDLKREYIEVDWEDFKEEEFSRRMEAGEACSGNKCEVIRF